MRHFYRLYLFWLAMQTNMDYMTEYKHDITRALYVRTTTNGQWNDCLVW